ncbi:MAG: glutamate 5-kinase, partial [Candidatus Omnitrophota bacterium]
TLLAHKIVPIINENDAVSVEEIKFGDNDTLSARVAAVVEAEGLLILTDVEGLFEKFDPETQKGKLIKCVDKITPEIEKMACGTDKDSCVGGMSSKIQAARIATNMGIPVVSASPLEIQASCVDFQGLVSSPPHYTGCGTGFAAAKSIGAKKHWIGFEAKICGKISVDEGAKKALVGNNKSLLAPGIASVEENFKAGDIVEIVGSGGEVFAKGKVNFSSNELQDAKGKKIKKEVVHRDNLVIL